MINKKFLMFLIVEILATLVAVFVFRIIDHRPTAASIAGVSFILVGALIILSMRKSPIRKQSWAYKAAWVHLFAFALPMMLFRWINPGVDFNNVTFIIWTGSQFHRASEIFYLILMGLTLFEVFRFRKES